MIAAFPAFFEEVAFRGVIVPVLKRALTVRETVFVSGAMFMILHLNPMSAPVLLAAGIMLGYLRIKSGSIWPCVMLHFTHNALILLFEFIHF
jgi:membrane protease YdiL (CAAX protease family)